MWDERLVGAIVRAAREDLQQQKWARDFADKLKDRGITVAMIEQTLTDADAVVVYRYRGLRSVGFWNERRRLIAVWSPLRPSRWVTAFFNDDGKDYLLGQDDAELIDER
ncbi:hypothetical protein Q2T83_12940 [Fervidibacter sacchari]|uniref:DUF4258 domain-containing protein n=1 Tax=Candidatus Fervidibacter sacchari TaxID=1448929 RepID=A0ABT2ENH5_9BACT|nr:hypothetical protein [Candidatus Fervidibacter sacchari]MCS3919507.1 hypothetical protein [Candidatus Fervidibacter sacchari]WKU15231.1 hypothetical protein Q2T83_12940 [Candidatus Fervidibacter sacchari]